MWYDLFSLFYDRALEDVYAPFRPAAVEALRPASGATVLDVPCGTGQSFPGLVAAVGNGAVIGVDRSPGMLRRARRRVARAGWTTVMLVESDASALGPEWRADDRGPGHVDGLLCALGLTALPDWEATAARLISLVRPGGRVVLLDVFAAERTAQTRIVERLAQADLSREVWRALDGPCVDVERIVLSDDAATFGGDFYLAAGTVVE